MAYALYDYCDAQGRNEFRRWTEGLQKKERIKLIQKLDLLQKDGIDGLLPGLVAGPVAPHIYKLRLRVDRQLRPRLCRGPIRNEQEITLLCGAFEVGDEDVPPNVNDTAVDNRTAVVHSPATRRCKHERIN